MKNNTLWVVDSYFCSDRFSDTEDTLIDTLKQNKTPFISLKYKPFYGIDKDENLEKLKLIKNIPVVIYGTIEFVKALKKEVQVIPGAYYSDDTFLVSNYIPKFEKQELFLNNKYIMMPLGTLKNWGVNKILKMFNTDEVFIKPDSGGKPFAGTILSRQHEKNNIWPSELYNLIVNNSTDTMCILSSGYSLEEEYRFVIANRKVVDGSQYMKRFKFNPKSEFDQKALHIAQKIANNPWQPDLVYTCDICKLNNGDYKVVELNSFSCAGMYCMDKQKIIKAVSKVAQMEFNGDISLGETEYPNTNYSKPSKKINF